MILNVKSKNGHTIEVDTVNPSGLDGAAYLVTEGADGYIVALNDELWHLLVAGTSRWLDSAQITRLVESWMVTVVNEHIALDESLSFLVD